MPFTRLIFTGGSTVPSYRHTADREAEIRADAAALMTGEDDPAHCSALQIHDEAGRKLARYERTAHGWTERLDSHPTPTQGRTVAPC